MQEKRSWLYPDFLWEVLGFLDRLVGGVGMRRGRRHPDELRPGDALDFWRVEAVERGRRILLGAEMRVPGQAWLELQVHPRGSGGSLLKMRAIFDPRGLAGLLYWYLLYPFHKVIFSGMAEAIRRRAEEAARNRTDSAT